MLKKVLIILFSFVLLSGCSKKDDVEEVSFLSWGSITETAILKDIINNFELENPSIKINFIHVPQNYFQKLHLLIASNTMPDIIFINNLYLPLYQKYLLDLSGIIDKSEFFSQAINCLSYEEKLLAVPRDVSNLVLYINTDKVNLNNNKIKTLDEMLDLLDKAYSKGSWGISFEEDVFFALPYLSYFGENFDEKFDPQSSKGLKFYKSLKDEYKVAPTKSEIGSSTTAQMFLDEKLIMYLSGRWMYPKISEKAKFNWIVIPFPQGAQMNPCDSSGWAISNTSKHKEASIKFVQYLSNNQNSNFFTKTGLIVPARKESVNFLNNLEHNEKAFIEALEQSKANNIFKNYKKLADKINKTF